MSRNFWSVDPGDTSKEDVLKWSVFIVAGRATSKRSAFLGATLTDPDTLEPKREGKQGKRATKCKNVLHWQNVRNNF